MLTGVEDRAFNGFPAVYIPPFDVAAFLTNAGFGREVINVTAKGVFFSRGEPADAVFYLQEGRAKLSVTSRSGKEAIITLLAPGDFIGEVSVAAVVGLHMTNAVALTACTVLRIERREMLRVMHAQQTLSDLFLAFMLNRNSRIQADLVDQLVNTSEKRLARVLLLMAEPLGAAETLIPKISQETLADMIGTTRARVNFFMNRFRKLGFLEYTNRRIRVHRSLLNIVVHA